MIGSSRRSTSKPPAVAYLYPEQITLPAGKPTTVALHFRIARVSTSTPTRPAKRNHPHTLSIPDGSGVLLERPSIPPAPIHCPRSQNQASVYTGEFTIQARLVATAGNTWSRPGFDTRPVITTPVCLPRPLRRRSMSR